MDQPLPPILKGLAAHDWDVVKLTRNPDKEKAWFAVLPQLSKLLADQARNAAQLGYANVILGGQGEGGGLALEAAAQVPVFGVLALAPNIGQSSYFPPEKGAERIINDIGAMNAQRAMIVLPADNQALPGINLSPAARQSLAARGIPYLLLDSQVHGYWGGYSAQMQPYADCAIWFFAPAAAMRRGPFQCYHDEVVTVMQSLNMNPRDAVRIWMGYVDGSGQPMVIVEHHNGAGSTIDLGMGGDLFARTSGHVVSGIPAAWEGNALTFSQSATEVANIQPTATPPYWLYRHLRGGGDWTGTLDLVFGH